MMVVSAHVAHGVQADQPADHRYDQAHQNGQPVNADVGHLRQSGAEKLEPGQQQCLRDTEKHDQVFVPAPAKRRNQPHQEELDRQHQGIDQVGVHKQLDGGTAVLNPEKQHQAGQHHNQNAAGVHHDIPHLLLTQKDQYGGHRKGKQN